VLGVYGMGVVTAVTARNTNGAVGGSAGVLTMPLELVDKQMEAIAEDLPVGGLKTGYLGSPAMIDAVAEGIRRHRWDKYVCDPVIHSRDQAWGGGADSASVHAYRKELLPLASVVTPNRGEAALLANMEIGDVSLLAGARKAAEKIVRSGARAVVVKGIATGDKMTDLFFDGDEFIEFAAKRATTKNTYGSGCLFSAILAAMLAQEIELRTAVDHARSFVSQAIEHHVKIGGGARPVNVLALTPQ
ncbi:MAG TPA: bifunctional hydroxymethylpyrimidine kinase/phosphomethylpyrimidine kinase, partial [Phycisphaerae bacterium]